MQAADLGITYSKHDIAASGGGPLGDLNRGDVHGLPARAGHPRGGGRLVGRPEHLWLPHHDEPRRDRRPRSQGMHTPRSEVSYHVSNSSDPANMHANMGEGVEYHTLYGGRPYPNHYTNPYP